MSKSEVRFLRLRSGGRYVLALQKADGSIDKAPHWNMEQALIMNGLKPSDLPAVEVEEYVEAYPEGAPPGAAVFVRRYRRRQQAAAVLWFHDGIHPAICPSVLAAVATAILRYRSQELAATDTDFAARST